MLASIRAMNERLRDIRVLLQNTIYDQILQRLQRLER